MLQFHYIKLYHRTRTALPMKWDFWCRNWLVELARSWRNRIVPIFKKNEPTSKESIFDTGPSWSNKSLNFKVLNNLKVLTLKSIYTVTVHCLVCSKDEMFFTTSYKILLILTLWELKPDYVVRYSWLESIMQMHVIFFVELLAVTIEIIKTDNRD